MDEWDTGPNRKKVLKKYGLSQIEYDFMLDQQGGVCAICGKRPGRKYLPVDHDHRTGQIRGILCNECNIGLGKFKDRPDLLMAAIAYLEKRNGTVS